MISHKLLLLLGVFCNVSSYGVSVYYRNQYIYCRSELTFGAVFVSVQFFPFHRCEESLHHRIVVRYTRFRERLRDLSWFQVISKSSRFVVDRLDIQVARWIQNYYTKETSLANLQSLADMTRDPKSKTAILKAIADRRQVINDDIVDIETKFRDRSPYCYQNRLFADLQNLLLETLAEEKCSMLPDVLLQIQIQKMFANVASPNKDF